MLPAQPNFSLIDGLACLQELTAHREPIGSRELARKLGLEPTRVNRLLRTLAHLGLAEQDDRRKYRPGPAVHVLAAQSLFGSGLLQRAFGPLESLLSLGHIVAMGVLWRDQTCYLYHAPDPTSHGIGHPQIFPATWSGIGMALLAHRPEEEVKELYNRDDGPAPAWTSPAEPTPPLAGDGGLLARLAQIRTDGYALVPVPDMPNRRTVAVVIGDPAYAAIGLSGTFGDDEVDTLVAALCQAVEKIEYNNEEKP